MISFIIPTRNNLPYLKLAYESIRGNYPNHEIVILDDNSTDDTENWLNDLTHKDPHLLIHINHHKQIGHTVLYDKGVELCSNDVFTIFHADMVCGPNYVENLLKHLKKGGVVAATRIEPPLHPEGKEKVTKDYGTYAEDFRAKEFHEDVLRLQNYSENKNITSKGIFAPWAMYKDDFLKIGGHDKLFAPFPYEDSDIFQRFILAGYDITQSRDAFVYHFTCRGHRWTKEVKKDDLFYKLCCAKNASHFIRKWGSWIENDENSYPIINKKYDVGFVAENCKSELLNVLEPLCNTIYTDHFIDDYIKLVQPGTPYDMTKRVKNINSPKVNDILVYFDMTKLNAENFGIIKNLPKVLEESGEIGEMEYDIFRFEIKSLTDYAPKLVNNESTYYKNQLRRMPESDPYCMDALFDIYQKVNKSV